MFLCRITSAELLQSGCGFTWKRIFTGSNKYIIGDGLLDWMNWFVERMKTKKYKVWRRFQELAIYQARPMERFQASTCTFTYTISLIWYNVHHRWCLLSPGDIYRPLCARYPHQQPVFSNNCTQILKKHIFSRNFC